MKQLNELFKKYDQKTINRQEFQLEAIDAINKLVDGSKNRASIFKCYKQNKSYAKIALNDRLELNKPFSRYFFKVFNILNKK